MTDPRRRRISTLGSRLTSTVSVAMVLLLLSLASLTGIAAGRLQDEVRSALGFTVIMSTDSPEAHINGVKTALMAHRGVDTFTYASADEILRSESEAMGEDIAELCEGNPYNSEFDVHVRPSYSSVDSIEALSAFFADLPSVSEVIAQSAVIDKVDSTVRRTALILTALGALLLIIASALISNTISLSIYGRRFIIHTMKLVGATPAYIRRPFVLSGIRMGLAGGCVAALILVWIRYYITDILPSVGQLAPWAAVWIVVAAVIIAGGVLTGITSVMAANRYLRASYDQMFLK